jgi:hypothetical protein
MTKNQIYKFIFFLALFFALFGLVKSSWAAGNTYYVCDTGTSCNANSSGWNTGNDANACTSKSSPCKTIKGGVGKISSGDTLIIGNGTYVGSDNMLANPGGEMAWTKDGSAGNYTTIKAEIDFGVIIDGQGARYTGYLDGVSYTLFRGLHFKSSTAYGLRVGSGTNVKVIRCIFQDTDAFNFAFTNMTNSLVEQSFAFGYGTYYFNDNNYWGANNRNIYRTNFVRRDGHTAASYSNHWSCYGTYQQATNNSYWQNDICVDSMKRPAESNNDIYTSGVFYSANTGKGAIIDQMIGINEHGFAMALESDGSTVTAKNSTFIMGQADWKDGILSYEANTYENLLISGATTNFTSGIWGVSGYNPPASFKNNIIMNSTIGINNVTNNSYCNLYGNATNYENCSAGTGNITTNPLIHGLLYPVRIESGSVLATAGSGGGRLGPEILYKIGRTATSESACGGVIDGMSCTLYNETGWNELQDGQSGRALAKLWPFPNENIIKIKLAAYSANGISGARGFATSNSRDGSPQTLTKYIWEYLGNQIPADVYGGSSPDTTPPAAPSGLSV